MFIKKIHILILLICLPCMRLFAQANDSIVKKIDAKCKYIEEHLITKEAKMLDLHEESNEGGQITAYVIDEKFKMIVVNKIYETGNLQSTYYFEDEKIIFALKIKTTYNRPYYWDAKISKENNDTAVFDESKSNFTIDKFYYQNEKLVSFVYSDQIALEKLLGSNQRVIDGMIDAEAQRLLQDAYKRKAKFKS